MTGIKPPPKKKPIALDLAPVKPLTVRDDKATSPLCFKVSPEFHRQFKAYAASRGEAMIDVLLRAVTKEMQS